MSLHQPHIQAPVPSATVGGQGMARDYYELLKPRVMSLVVFTAVVGLFAAPGHIHPWIGFLTILCIAVGAGASGALNMWYDADIDALMKRTLKRPVPSGAIAPGEALGFGLALSFTAVIMLGMNVGMAAAALLAFTIFFYVVIYTMGLKRRTPQNIVIGGAAGAFPPMISWMAVTGRADLGAISLFLLIFMWTPPHFWALSLWRSDDYARAGVPMLPVVKGKPHTRLQILLYTLALVPLGLTPVLTGTGGFLYLACAAGLGAWFLTEAIATFVEKDERKEPAAHRLFGVSLIYLTALFASLIVEKLLQLPAFPAFWS